jgi:uncharacterized protein YneF (UPF0154 family)
VIADATDAILSVSVLSPLAFLFGVGIGFLLANRYRLERRRNGTP